MSLSLHSSATCRASAFSCTMICPGKSLRELHSWVSTMSPGQREEAALRRVVMENPLPGWGLWIVTVSWPSEVPLQEPGLPTVQMGSGRRAAAFGRDDSQGCRPGGHRGLNGLSMVLGWRFVIVYGVFAYQWSNRRQGLELPFAIHERKRRNGSGYEKGVRLNIFFSSVQPSVPRLVPPLPQLFHLRPQRPNQLSIPTSCRLGDRGGPSWARRS